MTSHDAVFKLRKILKPPVMGNLGSRCGRGASDCCGARDAFGRVYAEEGKVYEGRLH